MRVLVVKLSSLGDVLQTTPLIRSLAFNHKVYFLTYRQNKSLVENNPHLTKVFTLEPLSLDIKLLANIIKNIFIFFAIISLRVESSINLHKAYRLNLLFKWLGIYNRIGLVRDISDKHNLTHPIVFNQKEHHISQYLKAADFLGCKSDDRRMEYAPVRPHLNKYSTHINKPYFVSAPGGGKNRWASMSNKRWPIKHFVSLFNDLSQSGYDIVLIGDVFDQSIIRSIKKQVQFPERLHDKSTELSLSDVYYTIQDSNGFVGNDSFLLHFASTTGVSTIGLFGPTSGALLAPLGTNDHYIQSDSNCSPCYDANQSLRSKAYTCEHQVCMEDILPQKVYNLLTTK